MAIEPVNQYNPNQPKSTERASDNHAKSTEKSPEQVGLQVLGGVAKEDGKGFGPDYVLDDSLKSKDVAGDVPFAAAAAAQTLAALPPMRSLGTASLTELSLQKMMQPRDKSI